MPEQLFRLAAFTDHPTGGNPAGVWLGDRLPEPEFMQRTAREVGYSETAFLAPKSGMERQVRYYSPEAEVPFCGHATIASGVVLGRREGAGTYRLHTTVGDVPVEVSETGGQWLATLTSVSPRHQPASADLVDDALACLGWTAAELDPALPPARAYAGSWHLVLAAASADRLARLDYDFERLKSLMLAHELTTLQLVHRRGPNRFEARDPFPVGGVVEDPATGSAAAALGGYLREAGLLQAPAEFVIHQGVAMGRPSRLLVTVPLEGGIRVTGTAVDL